MDAKDLSLAERVLAAADDAKPSIDQLFGLNWSASSELPALKRLYDDLGDLSRIVETLRMNRDGFLSRNEKDHQQLLKQCCGLLKNSRINCSGLYGELKGAMQHSVIFGGGDCPDIQRSVDANCFGVAQMRIWTMTLDLLVKVMRL